MEGITGGRKERVNRVAESFKPAPSGLIDPKRGYEVILGVEGDDGTPAERRVMIPHGILKLSNDDLINPEIKNDEIMDAIRRLEAGKEPVAEPSDSEASRDTLADSGRNPFDWHRWLKHEFYQALKKKTHFDSADKDIFSFLDEVEGMLDENDPARENLAKKRKDIQNIEMPSKQKKNESDEKFQERKERAWQSKLRTLATDFPPNVYVLEKLFPEVGSDAPEDDVAIPEEEADANEAREVPPTDTVEDVDEQQHAPLSDDHQQHPKRDRHTSPRSLREEALGAEAITYAYRGGAYRGMRFARKLGIGTGLIVLSPFAMLFGTVAGMWWLTGQIPWFKKKGGGGGHEKKEKKHEKTDDHDGGHKHS